MTTRSLRLALLLASTVLAGGACKGGPPPRGSASSGGPVTLVPSPEPGPPPADVIGIIESGGNPESPCFAWSPSGAVMCALDDSSIQAGATYSIDIVGPDAQRFVWYQHPEDQQFFDIDRTQVQHAAFSDAKGAARAGGFQGWAGNGVDVEIDQTVEVGGHHLRRTRVETESGSDETGSWTYHRDVIELDCGGRWVAVPFAEEASQTSVFANQLEAPAVRAVVVGGKLLFVAGVTWGMEGDHGGGTNAELIDPATACR